MVWWGRPGSGAGAAGAVRPRGARPAVGVVVGEDAFHLGVHVSQHGAGRGGEGVELPGLAALVARGLGAGDAQGVGEVDDLGGGEEDRGGGEGGGHGGPSWLGRLGGFPVPPACSYSLAQKL